MAGYFFDTSALVKYYHAESGPSRVRSILEEPARQVRISTLGLVEAQSVFAMKVRSSQVTRDVAGLLRARLMLDIAAGSIEIYTLTEDHFAEAERLIGRFAFSHRLRTLDALQLAVLDLSQQNLLDYFVVADRALAEIGASVSLKVINPEIDDQPAKMNP